MRVLVTEDSPLIQAIYRAVFKQYSHIKVDFADNAKASRSRYHSNSYDLVFFDVDLGESSVSGKDLSTEYRSLYPESKVIMATSHNEPEFLNWSSKIGAEVITKSAGFVVNIRQICEQVSALAA